MFLLKRSFLIMALVGFIPPGNCQGMPSEALTTPVWTGPGCRHSNSPCCRQPEAPCCKETPGKLSTLSKNPSILPHFPQGAIPSTRVLRDPALRVDDQDPLRAAFFFHPKVLIVLRL